MSKIVTRYGVEIDLSHEHKGACLRCQNEGRDKSSNNMHFYGLDENGKHRGSHCFACGWTIPSEDHMEKSGWGYEYDEEFDNMGLEFNKEVHDKLKENTGLDSKGYRGIRTDISKWFGVRYQYSEVDGSVAKTYYPCTKNYEISGYKVRNHPKDFRGALGEVGAGCDLFGQFRFKTTTGTILIVGGEIDMMSAFQMLKDAQKDKRFDPVAVVSSTVGETSAFKQVQAQYEWLNQAKKIIVAMDSDEAGQAAAAKLVDVLPRGKVYVMKMRMKDPNEYISTGREQDFINDFWAAKPYTPAGVHSSASLYESALAYADKTKLSLPDFLPKTSKMFMGGLVKGEATVLFSGSGQGKSTFMSAFTTNWALNDRDEIVGVLSLEATVDKYATGLFSDYLGVSLTRMEPDERKEYLQRGEIVSKINDMTLDENGKARFYVCDDRGADIEVVKEKILEMIIKLGVTILIIDPFSDLQSGMDISKQEELSSWLKKLLKQYPQVSLVLVAHIRKRGNGENAPLTEDSVIGSSTLIKSAAQLISIERDKLEEDPILRNVTKVVVHKNRHYSETGQADEVYYDWRTGKLYNFEQWKLDNPEMFANSSDSKG